MGTHAAIIGRFKGVVHFILHLQYDGYLENAGKTLLEFLVAHPPTHNDVQTVFAHLVVLFGSEGTDGFGYRRIYLEDPNQADPRQEFTYTVSLDNYNSAKDYDVEIEHDEVLFAGPASEALAKLPELIEAQREPNEDDDLEPVK